MPNPIKDPADEETSFNPKKGAVTYYFENIQSPFKNLVYVYKNGLEDIEGFVSPELAEFIKNAQNKNKSKI